MRITELGYVSLCVRDLDGHEVELYVEVAPAGT